MSYDHMTCPTAKEHVLWPYNMSYVRSPYNMYYGQKAGRASEQRRPLSLPGVPEMFDHSQKAGRPPPPSHFLAKATDDQTSIQQTIIVKRPDDPTQKFTEGPEGAARHGSSGGAFFGTAGSGHAFCSMTDPALGAGAVSAEEAGGRPNSRRCNRRRPPERRRPPGPASIAPLAPGSQAAATVATTASDGGGAACSSSPSIAERFEELAEVGVGQRVAF